MLLRPADVEFLHILAEGAGAGARDARDALAELPVGPPDADGDGDSNQGGANQGGEVPERDAEDVAEIDATVAEVTARLYAPALAPELRARLSRLPADLAPGLLAALVDDLAVAAGRGEPRRRLDAAARQLRRVRAALSGTGPPVFALLPDTRIADLDPTYAPWVDGLLRLVHPRFVLRLAADALAGPVPPDRHAAVLHQLKRAAPRLGRVPAADPPDVALYHLIRATRPERYRAAPPPGPAAEQAPVDELFPLFETPSPVRPDEEFPVEVGLTTAPQRAAPDLGAIPAQPAAFDLTITVTVANGTVTDGATRVLRVARSTPVPVEVVHVRAGRAGYCLVSVDYRIGARSVGKATRRIPIRPGPPGDPRPSDRHGSPDGHGPTAVPRRLPVAGGVPIDVEADVVRVDPDTLHWTLWRAGKCVGTAETTVPVGVVRLLDRTLEALEDRAPRGGGGIHMAGYLHHLARLVRNAVPPLLWNMLGDVGRAGRAPTLLIFSEVLTVPWTLARVPVPWLHDAGPLLGDQATVGVWPLLHGTDLRRPPPATLDLSRVGVVGAPLAESDVLRRDFAAEHIPARRQKIRDRLTAADGPDLLITETHGTARGLVLDEPDEHFAPGDVEGCAGTPVRFAVLNGCRLGRHDASAPGGEVDGMAAAFVRIGAGAVVAPLWNLRGQSARRLRSAFVEEVLSRGEPPAEVLRTRRAARPVGLDLDSVGYVHVGDPGLRVRWCASIAMAATPSAAGSAAPP